ncbi:MAG: Ppx/GppA family phosphatase [Promicromonosporaceae bacterium]|nr:Ppx/GppA family phosphatase [Promicromonosporaceae bacterium]
MQHAASPIRVAALDCGTNTFRLYVADVYPDGTQRQLVRLTEIVRLGQGVDRTGEISQEALERTMTTAKRYAEVLAELRPERIRMVATSASRDARNNAEFVEGIKNTLGVAPEVIPGHEEAALAFSGATRGLLGNYESPFLVVDLGGGSTELVLGESRVEAAYSMDVGSVRLTERWLHGDPPTAREIAGADLDVAAMLAAAGTVVPFERVRTIVGVAGTVTSLTAYYLGLRKYDPRAVDGVVLTPAEVARVSSEMLAKSKEERLALGFMAEGRADIIGAGALIWRDVVAKVTAAARESGREITAVISRESDMLEGIAASVAGFAPQPT